MKSKQAITLGWGKILLGLAILASPSLHAEPQLSDEFRLWSGCISPYQAAVSHQRGREEGKLGPAKRLLLTCPLRASGTELDGGRHEQTILALPQIETRGTERLLKVYIMTSTRKGTDIKTYTQRALDNESSTFLFSAPELELSCGNAQFRVEIPAAGETIAPNIYPVQTQHRRGRTTETFPEVRGTEEKTPEAANLFLSSFAHTLKNAPTLPLVSDDLAKSYGGIKKEAAENCLELSAHVQRSLVSSPNAETTRILEEINQAAGALRPDSAPTQPEKPAPKATPTKG